MNPTTGDALIKKTILYAGNKKVSFDPGTRVFFHFQTKKCDETKTVIDDSRKMGKPMELVLGKSFKFEVWESVVQMMSLNEVAVFTVDKSLVSAYPFVSKTLREAGRPQEQRRHHCCGVTLQNEGIGYDDLNVLIKYPCDLEFTIELLKVESASDYRKDTWQMTEQEKLQSIPALREEGNQLFRKKDYEGASTIYARAIGILEQLMLIEKPGESEWVVLEQMKLPLLLNFAQCKLQAKEYYAVIEHCTSALAIEPDNVKALYRRAKAHVGAWNPTEARADFHRAAQLDAALESAIHKELAILGDLERKRNDEDMGRLKGKMF